MKEIRDIILAYEEARQAGKKTALATLVHVEGSSYRRPGARMLITEDGQLTGAISGGCLEGDALRKAQRVIMENKPHLVTYDTMDEDDATLGIGLGCNGIIQVLIEPIDLTNPDNPVEFLKSVNSVRQNALLVTIFSLHDKKNPQLGTCILLAENGQPKGKSKILHDILVEQAKDNLNKKTSSFINYSDHQLTVFYEFIQRPIALVILGAGNDVIPVVDMATILGWDSTVIDGRSNYAKKERFAASCQVLVANPENVLKNVSIDERTVFLLMTHNYNYDMAMLKQLVNTNAVYVGMLGPRKKFERMIEEMNTEGIEIPPGKMSSIHSPVGLDIGAETSEEIALSILAEIKSIFANRDGQSLKKNPSVIHDRTKTTIFEVNLSGKK